MNIKAHHKVELCVIGAGPAGSAISRSLAQMGHEVLLLEKSKFPRRHVGESLSPGIWPLLSALAVQERIEKENFPTVSHALIRWERGSHPLRVDSAKAGILVDRGSFDQLLLDAAVEAGVQAIQSAKVIKPLSQEGEGWLIPYLVDNEIRHIEARFLVDAGGRRSLINGKRTRCFEPTLAVYAYWKGAQDAVPETRVEAGPNEWYWAAPLPDGTVNAAVFVDPIRYKEYAGKGVEQLYRNLLAQSSLLSGCLQGDLVSEINMVDSTMSFDEDAIGPNWIKVGGACLTLDPLSSQGVQSALRSALQGAVAVHTILRVPTNTAAAQEFYKTRQQETIAEHTNITGKFYSKQNIYPQSDFWTRRSKYFSHPPQEIMPRNSVAPLMVDTRLKLSENVCMENLPVISEGIIQDMPTMTHSALKRPCSFINGIAVYSLLSAISEGITAGELLNFWSGQMPQRTAFEILTCMWQDGLLEHVPR